MAEARVMVLRAAGINCDRETLFGFEQAGARADLVHINRLLERPRRLLDYGLLVLPGGFSYGDHMGAGKLLAIELRVGLGEILKDYRERDGLMLGICNGFQVLIKSGLLPDPGYEASPSATLTWNDSHRYEDRWVRLAVDRKRCLMAPREREFLCLPVAHGEGRFTLARGASPAPFLASHQAVFRYASRDGAPPCYPENPNGSEGDIAGLCDQSGQVLGLMPHPDRALFPYNHPAWTREPARSEGDGLALFRAAVQALR